MSELLERFPWLGVLLQGAVAAAIGVALHAVLHAVAKRAARRFALADGVDGELSAGALAGLRRVLPIEPLRDELKRIVDSACEWDKRVCVLQVTEVTDRAIQLRTLVSTQDASLGWDLRCKVHEQLVAFMQNEYPQYLPQVRTTLMHDGERREEAAAPRHATRGAVVRTESITP